MFEGLINSIGYEGAQIVKNVLLLLLGAAIGFSLGCLYVSYVVTKVHRSKYVNGAALVYVTKEGKRHFYTGANKESKVTAVLYILFLYTAWRLKGSKQRIAATDKRLATVLAIVFVLITALLAILSFLLVFNIQTT